MSASPRVAHSVRQAMIGSLLATVVLPVAFGATAGADPVSTLSAQVQAAEAQVNADAARIHEFTVAYDQASTRSAALSQEVQGTTDQLTALHNQVAGTERTIRNAAVLAYTGQVSGSLKLATANPTQIGVSQVYVRSTVASFSNALGALNLQQQKVATGQTTLRDEERAHQRQLAQAAAARQQALSQAASAQQVLNRTQAELVSTQEAGGGHGPGVQQAAAAQQAQTPAQTASSAKAASAPQGAPVGNSLKQTVASALSAPTTITPVAGTPTPVSTTTSSPTTAPAPGAPRTGSAPTTRSVPSTTAPTIRTSGTLARLRQCESGGNYQENSGDGFYGAYQFSPATWSWLGLPGRPDQAPSAAQDRAALTLAARGGWSRWPTCSALLGLGS